MVLKSLCSSDIDDGDDISHLAIEKQQTHPAQAPLGIGLLYPLSHSLKKALSHQKNFVYKTLKKAAAVAARRVAVPTHSTSVAVVAFSSSFSTSTSSPSVASALRRRGSLASSISSSAALPPSSRVSLAKARVASGSAEDSKKPTKSKSGKFDYDLFTIGAGSGGVRASRFAASTFGIRAAVCEMPYARVASDELGGAGGTCVLRGCVPKKLLVYGSEFNEAFRDAAGFGWKASSSPAFVPGWQDLQKAKNAELERLNGVYKRLLDGASVDFVEGRGRLVDEHTVAVDEIDARTGTVIPGSFKTFTAEKILLATGGRPFVPTFPGSELCLTSDDILDLPDLPSKIAVIGGGYIAVEFASIFNNFGVPETHLVYRQPLPLRGFDEEVRQFATDEYKKRGVRLHPGLSPVKLEKDASTGTLTLTLGGPGKSEVELTGLSHVLAATGRKPNTKHLALEAAGVQLDPKTGAVAVDEASKTNVDSIYAVGDVTNRVNLTPVALMEGMAFAKNVFGGDENAKPDYSAIASAVFSTPTISSVGISEEEAAAKGKTLVFSSSFRPMKNTISGSEGKALMKVVVCGETDKVERSFFFNFFFASPRPLFLSHFFFFSFPRSLPTKLQTCPSFSLGPGNAHGRARGRGDHARLRRGRQAGRDQGTARLRRGDPPDCG